MNTKQPKKMIILDILNILKKYSDKEHTMTQQDIADKLREDYMMEVDRKTVKKNLMNLLDLDIDIDYTEISREDKDGRETSMCTDWYIQPEFDDSELRLIIDSLLFSTSIPPKQCKALIEKIIGLSNIYFGRKVTHVSNLPNNQPRNDELFFTIDTLDDAISKNKKVAFIYNEYGADKKLHPRRQEEYIVNPYQMVATNGRYYLICNNDKYDNLSNYRVDRITNIRILEDKRKPLKELREGELNLPRHMAEHIYMFAGQSVNVKFKAKNYIIGEVVDWFGTDSEITPVNDEESMVEVKVNENAFFFWAIQYGEHTEVLEPAGMRERVKEAVKKMYEKYC